MATEIKVPTLGESVTTATVARWLKKAGEAVAVDEPIVELETDKVTVEVPAPSAGTLGEIHAQEGAEVEVGAVLALLEAGTGAKTAAPAANPSAGVNPPPIPRGPVSRPATPPADVAAAASAPPNSATPVQPHPAQPHSAQPHPAMPSASKLMEERGIAGTDVAGTGKDGRITKGDVLAVPRPRPQHPSAVPRLQRPQTPPAPLADGEERVKMTRLRRTIAQRLKEAQNNAAMLTTFNEVDMSAAMALRAEYKRRLRKEAQGRPPRLHVLLRPRLRRSLARSSPPSTPRSTATTSSTRSPSTWASPSVAPTASSSPSYATSETMGFAQVEGAIAGFGKRARDGQLKTRGALRRQLHHHQWRRLRQPHEHPHPQRPPEPASSACTRSRTAPWPSNGKPSRSAP